MKSVIFFLGLFVLVKGQTTTVNQCIYQEGSVPINTHVEGCVTPPCQFPQLTTAVISIIFRAPRTMRSMRTLANAYILGPINVEYDLGEAAETCDFLVNTYCPVLQDEVVQYTLNMFIEPTFPVGAALPIEFRIVDEDNGPVMCIRLQVAILSPQSRGVPANSTVVIEN